MDCKLCEIEEVESGRAALGYSICLTCGEAAAKQESERKSRRVAIAYDKGAYQYIADGDDPKDFG
jgi:hypothetical protein